MIDVNTKTISLNELGIENATVRYQLSSSELHQETLDKGQGKESSLGAIAVNTSLSLNETEQQLYNFKNKWIDILDLPEKGQETTANDKSFIFMAIVESKMIDEVLSRMLIPL